MAFRWAADALTAVRVLCGAILVIRASLGLLLVGVLSDWIDGPLARRAGPTQRGARADLEADSILTLGAALAAMRCGAPAVVLVAPVLRYAIVPARLRDDVRWDRGTDVAQMLLLGGAIARLPTGWLAIPVTAARCAVLVARAARPR